MIKQFYPGEPMADKTFLSVEPALDSMLRKLI
jgi:hypothetical protein